MPEDAVMTQTPALVPESEAGPLSAYLGALVALRRDLHAHPELKFEEHRTADRIAAYLSALGLPMHRGLGRTGIVATIVGKGGAQGSSARAIGITAMLLGAAALLAERPDFDGTVHLIFQPGEEGGAGARLMMEEGLFTMFPCDAVFALHNWPSLPAGEMGVRVGPIMASANRFEIRVHGRGGHAALPHTTVDPIPVACAIVGQLQTLVSRAIDPLDSAVLTVGKIEAGTIENIIPDEAAIYGTCRTLSPQTLKRMLEGIERIASHVAAAHDAKATVVWKPGYPSTCNTRDEAHFMGDVMREMVGEQRAHPDVMPAMTAEDFGFMLEQIPGAYGFIGNGAYGQPGVTLHSPHYDFNDDNIALGARFWERLVRGNPPANPVP